MESTPGLPAFLCPAIFLQFTAREIFLGYHSDHGTPLLKNIPGCPCPWDSVLFTYPTLRVSSIWSLTYLSSHLTATCVLRLSAPSSRLAPGALVPHFPSGNAASLDYPCLLRFLSSPEDLTFSPSRSLPKSFITIAISPFSQF